MMMPPPTSAVDFHAFCWEGYDREVSVMDAATMEEVTSLRYTIDAYGRTACGQSVCAHVDFTPYFFVGIQGASGRQVDQLKATLSRRMQAQLTSCVRTRRKDVYGFTSGALQDFLLCRFMSMRAQRKAAVIVTEAGLALYESNVPPELRLMHIRDLPSVGWVRCTRHDLLEASASTCCDLEFNCSFQSLEPLHERTDSAPLVVASFDIECVSASGAFPNAKLPGDCIIMVGTTFWRISEEQPYRRHVVTLGQCAPIDGVDVEACQDEAHLLLAWAGALRREQADVVLGYNIWGFDFKYLYERAATLGGVRTPATAGFLRSMGKSVGVFSEIKSKKLESSAYGQNEFFIPTMPGVLQIDLLAVIKKEYKLGSYKLDAVSTHFLGEHKVDLPIKQMFALFRDDGGPDAIRQIAEYCVQDTALPIKLMQKLALYQNMVQMANACSIPFAWLATRGQQVRVFSVLLKQARNKGYLCPAKPQLGSKDSKYTGATVLEAKQGPYMRPITCLDFASLYPSIMRAHNLCHTTLVLDEARYGSLEGVEYEVIDLGDGQPPAKFATSYQDSILPSLLADLAQYRKDARVLQKKAKDAGDSFLAELYNGKQLAYKVTMNSLYGFCGAAGGMLPCVPIAAAVTTIGRNMIAATKSKVEELYAHLGAEVVYGDSVAGYTPVLVRGPDAVVQAVPIQELAAAFGLAAGWRPVRGDSGKEACELPGVHAWTEEGWTPVERVIRHAHTEPLIRVTTHTGLVDCTQHHSLLLEDARPVTPAQVTLGQRLLQAPFPPLQAPPSMQPITDRREAKLMGMFFGSSDCYLNRWALTAPTRARLQPYKDLVEALYPGQSWAVYQVVTGTATPFALVPMDSIVGGLLRDFSKERVPHRVLLGSPAVRGAFLEGLRDSDSATISMHGYSCFSCDSQLGAMTLMMLTEALGYTTSITPNFGVVLTRAPVWRHAHAIKKVAKLPAATQYVYDLTTASHHFQAGPGHLVVHNTDSVMVDFKVSLADSFKLGEEAAERVTGIFKEPIMLEFEKVFSPYLLFSKKRYCGLMYASNPEVPDKLDAKGISLVRRDTCGLVKRVSQQALDLIMYKADPAGAIEVVRQAAQQLMDGQVPMAELQMSKSLRASYTNLQPHDVVRNKIASRSPGEEPRAGDRVEFVYVEDPDCASRNVTVRAEDPQWAAAHGMRVDYAHYFSLLKSALSDIVSVLGHDVDDVFTGVGEAVYRAARQKRELHYQNVRGGQLEITQFFAGPRRM